VKILINSGLSIDTSTGALSVDTTIATQSHVATQIANLVGSAPGALDTLNELAAALGDDANYATTVTTSLAGKQDTITSSTDITANNVTVSRGHASPDSPEVSATTICDISGHNHFNINVNSTTITHITLGAGSTNIVGQSGQIIITHNGTTCNPTFDFKINNVSQNIKWFGGTAPTLTVFTSGNMDIFSYFVASLDTVLMNASVGYA